MSGQPIIFDFTVSIGGMTAPIARVTLDGAGEQGSSLLSLQLAEDIPDFVRSMSSAAADQIGKALLMDAKRTRDSCHPSHSPTICPRG